MKFTYMFTLAMCIFLASCDDTEKMKHNAADTIEYVQGVMSGKTLSGIKMNVEEILEDVKDTKKDVENRVEKVSTGIDMIKGGKDLIDEGLEREKEQE